MNPSTRTKARHFQSDIILLRPLVSIRSVTAITEMMLERGLTVDHTTVSVGRGYPPELDKRCRPYLKQTNDSWRVDETYISVKGSGSICIGQSIQREIPWTT